MNGDRGDRSAEVIMLPQTRRRRVTSWTKIVMLHHTFHLFYFDGY